MTQPPGSPSAAIKLAYRSGQTPARPAPRKLGPERWTWLAVVLVIVLPIAALWPLCRHDFTTWDDNSWIKDNPTLNPVTWHSLHVWWTTPKGDLFVPITYMAWGAIAYFAYTPGTVTMPGYLNPVAFHTANLVLHVLCCLVVFALLRLLLREGVTPSPGIAGEGCGGGEQRGSATGGSSGRTHGTPTLTLPRSTRGGNRIGRPVIWPAAAGALLFGLHPVQVEAIGWASGFKDVLSGLLALTAMWQYLVAVKLREGAGTGESGRRAAARRGGWGSHYAIATVAFVLAMLAKPNALMAPVLAGILDGMLVGRSWRRAIWRLWPWLVLSAAWMVAAKFVQPTPGRPLNVATIERPVVAIASIGFYVRKILWPANLANDYGLKPGVMVQSPWLVAEVVVLATAAVLLWLARRRAKPMVAGAVFFVAALLPVLGFVTFDFQDYSNVADHYLYVPMFGIALMAAWLAGMAMRWRGWATAAGAAAVLGALGAASYSQTQYWLDTETLFVHTMDVNPDSAAAYHELALVEIARAANAPNPLAAHSYAEAGLKFAQESIDHRPGSEMGYIAKGMALYDLGRTAEAARQYAIALRIDPHSEPALEDLGGVLGETGRYAEAEKVQTETVRLYPEVAADHFDLGLTLEIEGKLPESIRQYEIAIQLDPFVPKYHTGLAESLGKSGQIRAALNQLDLALRLDPRNEKAQKARRYWLGVLHR